jgi:hypothetical protein
MKLLKTASVCTLTLITVVATEVVASAQITPQLR